MSSGLFVIGATHHTAPIAIREKLTLDAAASAELASSLSQLPGLREFAFLNTCNRVEFYGVAGEPAAVSAVVAAFCRQRDFSVAEFEQLRLHLAGRDAVQHLLEVASGLDSQMLGENEIFGQVKEAYDAAHARGSAGPVLNRLFQKSFQAAKYARTHTAISSGQVSVANVAVDLACDIFGGLKDARILLLGAGEIGEKTARALRSRGAGALTVASRRLERSMELAKELGASALPFEQREARLAEFDVVIGSTSAPDAVISRAAAVEAIHKRPARPLFFVDLAVPRDIDPSVADLQNVFLYNLDDLAAIADRNRQAREAEVTRARQILAEKADSLWRQLEPRLASRTDGDGRKEAQDPQRDLRPG